MQCCGDGDDDIPDDLLDFAREIDRSIGESSSSEGAEIGRYSPPLKRQKRGKDLVSLSSLPYHVLKLIATFTSLPRMTSKLICEVADRICRDKIVSSLNKCFACDHARLGESIEEELLSLLQGQRGKKYRSKATELLLNLRRNEPLRQSLIRGETTPGDLVRMSPSDMATAELRLERKINAAREMERITKHQHDVRSHHTVTRRFQCSECGYGMTKYSIWRRKLAVDRIRVVVHCLRCRNMWDL